MKYLKVIQISTAKKQNTAGGCKQEFTLETEKIEEPMHSAVKRCKKCV